LGTQSSSRSAKYASPCSIPRPAPVASSCSIQGRCPTSSCRGQLLSLSASSTASMLVGQRSQRRRGGRSEHRARGAGRGAQDAGRQPGARAQHSAAAEQPGASAGRRADGARRRASPCSVPWPPCPAAGLLPVVQGPRCAWPAGLSGCESPAVSCVNFASSALPACAGSGFFRPDQGRGSRGRADAGRAAGFAPRPAPSPRPCRGVPAERGRGRRPGPAYDLAKTKKSHCEIISLSALPMAMPECGQNAGFCAS